MNPIPYSGSRVAPPPPAPYWVPVLPPNPPPSSCFWHSQNVNDQLSELHDTLSLATAMQKELETLVAMKDTDRSTDPSYICGLEECLKERGIDLEMQESVSVDAANALMSKLRALLEPFRCVVDETVPWEEKSVAVRFSEKRLKSKRNKLWRKRKRQRVAQMCAKEHELFEQADKEADEWRAREVAKDIAQQKVEKMKEIAKLKAKEERKKLESELELVLIVEKLQELRSIRIQKLKKQGHFLPEEDDKFLERVRAAVEEEERQAMAAADTAATKDAIATAEESRKTVQTREPISKELSETKEVNDQSESKVPEDQLTESKELPGSSTVASLSDEKGSESHKHSKAYETVANLPIEFYHYYHGSSNDMGTLIEVRRTWDTYIRPGGSRIPGHWIAPPPPADDVWASYLIRPK